MAVGTAIRNFGRGFVPFEPELHESVHAWLLALYSEVHACVAAGIRSNRMVTRERMRMACQRH